MSDVDDLDFTPESIERLIDASADHLDDWYADRGITTTRRKYRDALAASEATVASLRAELERLTRGRDEAEKSDMSARDMLNDLEAEVERLTKALRDKFCPRPCNGRPDDFDVGDCVDAGECGCSAARALDRSPGVESGK